MQVGVLSLYYKNHNYGGLLQAYALCRALQKQGFNAEQICHLRSSQNRSKCQMCLSKFKRLAWYFFHWQAFKERLAMQKINPPIDVRIRQFEEFEQKYIPHTDTVYTDDTLTEAFQKYDAVIVGSDKVWNFDWTPDEYLLEHVPNGIKKFLMLPVWAEHLYVIWKKTGLADFNIYLYFALVVITTIILVKPFQMIEYFVIGKLKIG